MGDYLYSGRRITLPAALAAYGTDEFDDALIGALEIKEDELPTDEFCKNGGLPHRHVFKPRTPIDQEQEIHIIVDFEFDEVVASSCHDKAQEYAGCGKLDIWLDKQTGEASVLASFDN